LSLFDGGMGNILFPVLLCTFFGVFHGNLPETDGGRTGTFYNNMAFSLGMVARRKVMSCNKKYV